MNTGALSWLRNCQIIRARYVPVFHERTRACAKQNARRSQPARPAHVNRIEVIEVILSPSHRYMQTIRKAPSYKPVDILGVDSDRCFGQLMASEGSLFFVGQIFLSLLRIDQQ